jgi:hypothetical protein
VNMTRTALRFLLILFLSPGRTPAQETPSPPPQKQDAAQLQKTLPERNSDADVPCPLGRNKTAESKFADYVIRTYRWPEPEGCLRISKQGKLVYSLESTDFNLGGNFVGSNGVPLGADVTGRGIPSAVVAEWSGGVHSCFTLHVFELGDHFREVAKIEADDSDGANFVDLNRDGHYEFEGNDWAFAYWNSSFMQSPAPRSS